MKITFSDKSSIEKGSVRIWIHNLYNWMKEIGYDVQLNAKVDNETNVVIFGKSTPFKIIQEVKNKFSNIKIGIINPSDAKKNAKIALHLADFFIVGSIEEQDWYLKYNKNVFIFPLIETIFNNKKIHKNKEEIILAYHGNKHHLEQFSPNITEAINIISKKQKLKLIAIYDIKNTGKWKTGRPNIEIEDIQWNINSVEQNLLRADIGIVSGLNPINNAFRKIILNILKIFNRKQTRFANDYIVEYKNTTNSGRAFVFHQLGIPVISDFLPSSFHILGDEKNGFLAHSTEAWIRALECLSKSAQKRTEIAENAEIAFNKFYNPKDWAKKIHKQIKTLVSE